MTKTDRFQWRITAAIGHAVIFWLFVKLLTLIVEDSGTLSHSGIVLISGLTAWLLCIRGIHRARIWQFALTGYLAVVLDIVIALTIETTAIMGRFEIPMAATSIAALLPWVLVPWGTLMAGVSAIYGILLGRLTNTVSPQPPSSFKEYGG